MSFSIFLDDPKAIRSPGDWISGHVQITKTSTAGTFTLYFSGRSKVNITERRREGEREDYRHYHSKALFFRHSYPLQSRDGLNLPFQIQVPLTCEQIPEDQLKQHEAQVFFDEPPWTASYGPTPSLIPTSMSCNGRSGVHLSFGVNIAYKITAELTKDDSSFHLFSHKDEEVEVPVQTHQPPQNQLSQLPQADNRSYDCTSHTLRLLSSHAVRTSFSLFSSRLDDSEHVVPRSWPSTSIPFPFPLTLSLSRIAPQEPNSKGQQEHPDSAIPTPQYALLKRFTLTLVSLTRVRLSKPDNWFRDVHDVSGQHTLEIYDVKWDVKDDSANTPRIPLEGQTFDMAHHLGITMDTVFQADARGRLPVVPTFQCPNVVRSYMLEWRFELVIAGEEVEWNAKASEGTGIPLRLLAGDGREFRGGPPPQMVQQIPLPPQGWPSQGQWQGGQDGAYGGHQGQGGQYGSTFQQGGAYGYANPQQNASNQAQGWNGAQNQDQWVNQSQCSYQQL